MDKISLEQALADLPLGPLRYFERIETTNGELSRWADQGAPDLSLIVANEQTAGRGRSGRRWITPPDAALAFSLLLRPDDETALASGADAAPPFSSVDLNAASQPLMRRSAAPDRTRWTALGALAVCEALETLYGLQPRIKWPNDVLLERRKVCGILAEAHWQGDRLQAVILGIGVNITPASAPADGEVIYPATSVARLAGRDVERTLLLYSILQHIVERRGAMDTPDFIQAWDARLAFKGEPVLVFLGSEAGGAPDEQGELLGVDANGCLRLCTAAGEERRVCSGELRLRPANMETS